MQMQTRIVYLILHYNTEQDTYACVESIRKFSNSPIVIVCNGSRNKSDEDIKRRFTEDSTITVLMSLENLGFARGNNLGISHVRDNDMGEIIVCLNNDIIMTDDKFENAVIKEYLDSKFAVGGVDILNPFGVHCSPNYEEFPTNETVDRAIRKFRNAIFRCSFCFGIGEILYAGWKRITPFKTRSTARKRSIMTLHGCCLIFTPAYFDVYDGLCSDTYLYGEEIILSYQCFLKGLKVSYIPSTCVLHNESKATKQEYKKTIKRHLFYYENILESTMTLKKIINEK